MLKHENGRMEEKEYEKQVLTYEQKYEMIENEMEIDIAESKRKIELGRIMTDIAEKKNMNISLLPKDMQEAIDLSEKFGQNMKKRDIQ